MTSVIWKGFIFRFSGAQKFELDGAWSIRNMNVGGGSKAPKSDGLTYNANNKYYSRHSGAAKGILVVTCYYASLVEL